MGKYDSLSKQQLLELLEKRDREKKLGLVWERDEIEADNAIDANFVALSLDESLSDKPAPWRNLVIEADNFDALRWLRMTHARQIKCIYVDPPYNTGSRDWVYNDHYVDKEDRFRFSTWLEFLYRRFLLARDLLTEDGVILVSINDDNRSMLELMLDQALPGMRIGSFVWRTRTGGNEGGEHFYTDNHEHVLAYGMPGFRFSGTEKTFEMYRFYDEARDEYYRLSDMSVAVSYDNPRAGQAYYPLRNPETDVWYPCTPGRVWAFTSRQKAAPNARVKTKFIEDWIADKRIHFPVDQRYEVWETREALLDAVQRGDVPKSGQSLLIHPNLPGFDEWVGRRVGFGTPAFKRYKSELKSPTQPLSSWVTPNNERETIAEGTNAIVSATNDEGAKAIKDIFGAKAFNYAKPVSLIRELLRQASSPGDVILDFFAGSSTTAQAVMELNAEANGSRQFIMVSSTEATAEEPEKNICRDVTAERIRRINRSEDAKLANLAAEFAYVRARSILFEDLDQDIEPQEVWSCLEGIHSMPLTVYDKSLKWQESECEGQTIIYADKVGPDVIARVNVLAERRANLIVYTWAPGQLSFFRDRNIEVRPVRETLVKRFQQ